MKRFWLLILYAVTPFWVIAQQQTEYNKRGDEALERLDYSDARLFYGEGVPNCDMYSIHQLTTIWLTNEQIRTSMHNQMSRCLSCLSVKATENDTAAVSKLILYYTEGIGTPKSDELAYYWTERLAELRRLMPATNGYNGYGEYSKPPRIPMQFFAGYSFSIEAPVGVTVGGVGQRVGWYARFKSNMSFQSSDYSFSGDGPNRDDIFRNLKKKKNTFSATAGLVVKCTPWLYTSIGAGYGQRNLLYELSKVNDAGEELKTAWYKKTDSSYNGVSLDVDVMLRYGILYLSVGGSTLNFEYIDLNAGVGVFF